MLNKLRKKKTQKRIWIVLAILIVPAFVLWGSGSMIRSKQEGEYAGRIFGQRISFIDYKDALDATRTLAIMRYGDNYQETQKNLNLEADAWERLILLAEARSRRIKVSDKEVVDFIESYPFFQHNGQFDKSIYLQITRYVFRTQPRDFEEQTRQNLMISKLSQEVTKDLPNLTDKEIQEEYHRLNEEISLYYITANPADFTKDVSANEGELKDYFLKNSIQFKQPLSFNIEYVSLPVGEKDNQAINDSIKNLVSRLRKNNDFAKVAKEAGLTLKETGLFAESDPIPGIGWSPQITNLISKASVGQFVTPIFLDKNYYILKVKERKEPYIPELEKIKDKVKEAFIKDRAREIARQMTESCLKKLKELSQTNPKLINLEQSAKDFGLKSGSTVLFKFGSYIEGIGASDNFWLAAQNLKEDEFGEIIETSAGFYIIKLKSRISIDEKKFEGEKKDFSKQVLEQRKQEYFARFAEELKRRAQRY